MIYQVYQKIIQFYSYHYLLYFFHWLASHHWLVFFAKFYVFKSVIEQSMYFLAIVGLLSTVIAAFYYLRIIKVIYFDEEREKYDTDHSIWLRISLTFSTLLTLLYFIFPSKLVEIISRINII